MPVEQPADGAKIYYRLIEAATGWSGLLRLRAAHPGDLWDSGALPEATEFPRWPMLRLNTERIFDALAHGEMPYGRRVWCGTRRPAMDDLPLTVRHRRPESPMAHYYPARNRRSCSMRSSRHFTRRSAWTQRARCWPSAKRSRRGWRNTLACTRRCAPSTRRR